MRTNSMGRWPSYIACLLLLLLSGHPVMAQNAALTSVLDQVPANAPIVIVVPNVDRLSQKLATLNDALSLNVPQMTDALGELKREMNIAEGFRDDGAFALVLTDLPHPDQDGQPTGFMIIPVTNPDQFLGNFGAKDTGEDVIELTHKDGRNAWARVLSRNFVLMGDNQQKVTDYKPGRISAQLTQDLGKLGRQYSQAGDALTIIDMRQLATVLKPQLRKVMDEALQQLDAQAAGPGRDFSQAMLKLYDQTLQAVVRDSTAALVSLDVSDNAVGLTGTLQFAQGSPSARIVGTGGGATAHLDRLPNQPYLFASSFDFSGIAIDQLINNVNAILPPAQDQGNSLIDLIRMVLPLARLTQGTATAYYTPQQMGLMGGSLFNGVNIIRSNDAPAYVRNLRNYIEQLPKFNIPVAPPVDPNGQLNPDAPVANMSFTSTYNPGVLKLEDNVSVDQYQVSYNLPPELLGQMGQMGPMIMMLGGTGQSGYVAAKGNYVVTTTTPDAALLRQALAALDQKQGLGAASTIANIRSSGLPPHPSFESYLSLAGVASTANSFLAMMAGQDQVLKVPANLPPLAMGISVEDSGVAGRVYLPMPALLFIKDSAARLQALGGQGPAGPGVDGMGGDPNMGPPPPPMN